MNFILSQQTRDNLLLIENITDTSIFRAVKDDLQNYIKMLQNSKASNQYKCKKLNHILELFKVIDFYYYEKVGESIKVYTVFEYTVDARFIENLTKEQGFTLRFEKPFEFVIEGVNPKNPVAALKLKKLSL